MGCGASSDDNPHEIKHDFKQLKIEKIDKIFDTAKEILEPCEDIRSGLSDDRDDMIETSFVDHLKDETKISVVEAVRVWLWAVSANHKGNLEKCRFNFTENEPYFDIEIGIVRPELNEFKDSLIEWIKAL